MKKLLQEQTAVLIEILEEATPENGGRLKIKVPKMSIADEINGNNRVYPLKPWSREIAKLGKLAEKGQLVGSADHPLDGKSRVGDAAIRWTKIWMDGKETLGEGYTLPTAKGKDLESLIRAGVLLDVSSRAYGTAMKREWNGKLADVVQEDLKILTFDAVIGGSVEGSQMQAVNEQKREGSMEYKETIEALRAEHKEAFDWYDGQLKESLAKKIESDLIEETKKQKQSEEELRAKVADEYKPKLAKADKDAKVVAGLRALIGESEETGDEAEVDDKEKDKAKAKENVALKAMKEQLAALEKKNAVSDAKVQEMTEQLETSERKRQVSEKIAEVTKGKKFSTLLVERLHERCQKLEDVETELKTAEDFFGKLLTEAKIEIPAGSGHVNGEAPAAGQLTEKQKQQRRAAGL